jgi:hypothetical protein
VIVGGGAGFEQRECEYADDRKPGSTQAGPATFQPVALAGDRGPGHHLDPRRSRGDHGGERGGRAHRSQIGAGSLGGSDRDRRGNLHSRGVPGCALLLIPDRSLRAKEPLQHHFGHLLALHGRYRFLVEFLELRPFQVPGGGGHRRGVLGDLLCHRRVDPRTDPGSGGARHQRQLLGRRGGGQPPERRPPERALRAHVLRLEARLRDRSDPGPGRAPDPALRPREPALARHPRTKRRGRGGGWSGT